MLYLHLGLNLNVFKKPSCVTNHSCPSITTASAFRCTLKIKLKWYKNTTFFLRISIPVYACVSIYLYHINICLTVLIWRSITCHCQTSYSSVSPPVGLVWTQGNNLMPSLQLLQVWYFVYRTKCCAQSSGMKRITYFEVTCAIQP